MPDGVFTLAGLLAYVESHAAEVNQSRSILCGTSGDSAPFNHQGN
jgi:hypothetical protein